MEMKRYRIIVRGVVQGVGYRYFTLREARDRGITGWVRNREDGSVEVVCEGKEKPLMEFIERLKQGPYSAIVKEVSIEEERYKGEFKNFEIRF